ncbi:MAG: hypothetical protein PHU21_10290 [Elusimicrobia bacterium]|nr:hypothetical protein [Elusimicrobiota bacterium]
MRGKALSRLLFLLGAALPGPGWAARVALPPAVVPSLRAAPLAPPARAGVALSALAAGLGVSPPAAPALLPSVLPPAPAVSAAPQVSPLAVLTQAGVLSGQALKPAPAEAAAASAARVFDQSDLGLGGVRRSWGKLYQDGRELEVLGEGSFGRVYVHPRDPGAVVKLMTSMSADIARQTARQDSQVGMKLARAGAGPAIIGVREVPGRPSVLRRWLWRLLGLEARAPPRPTVVKERVYGDTVLDLIEGRRFTPKDYELVMRMLERMAEAGLKVGDMRTANIMIGHTASEPERRAYIVDGGWLLPVKEGSSREDRLSALKSQQVQILGGGGSVGWSDALDPFDDILREGLARSRPGP